MCVVVFDSFCFCFSLLLSHSQFSENPDNQSLSVLTFTPAIDDDGKHLSCRSSNPHIKDSTIEDKWQLVVHCKLMNHYIVVDFRLFLAVISGFFVGICCFYLRYCCDARKEWQTFFDSFVSVDTSCTCYVRRKNIIHYRPHTGFLRICIAKMPQITVVITMERNHDRNRTR